MLYTVSMGISLIFAIVFAVLFVVAFVSKRRFGALGLALIAGETLSQLWAGKLTPIVAEAGVTLQNPPLSVVVASALVILPALLLLTSGPSYHHSHFRIIGAGLFALLATALLIEPLGSAFWLADQNRAVYDWLVANKVYIVTGGVIIALFDLLGAHTSKPGHHSKSKH